MAAAKKTEKTEAKKVEKVSVTDEEKKAFQESMAKLVLEAARDEKHSFHAMLEWDDQKAAEAYREIQLQDVIRKNRKALLMRPAKNGTK